MKRQLTYILYSFVLLNLLVSLPLLLTQNQELAKFSFLIIVAYSAIWFTVARLIKRAANKEVDQVSIGLGAVIGVKFFMTVIIILLFYRMGLMNSNAGVIMLASYYVAYSIIVNMASSIWLKTMN